MKEAKGRAGWIIGLVVLLVLFVSTLLWALVLVSQLGAANASLAKYTSGNSRNQQQCIQDAQNVAAVAPGLSTTAPNLTAAISACQAQYPTN